MYKGYKTVWWVVLLFISALPFIYFFKIKTVSVTKLNKAYYSNSLQVTGITEAAISTSISLEYPVYIKDCFVNENCYVNKGQLMFVLDTEKMQQSVNDYSFTDVKTSSFNIDKNDLFDISGEIYASESGIVHNIAAESGNIIMANENLCTISQEDNIILKITLNQEDYTAVSVGDKIEFTLNIAPAKKYTGTIIERNAVVRKENTLTGNKTVIDIFASIDFTDEFIVQGLQFTGTIINPYEQLIYTLPYEYINQDSAGEYVNIYCGGNIEKKYIETGIETPDEVEVKTFFPEETIFIKDTYKGKFIFECFE